METTQPTPLFNASVFRGRQPDTQSNEIIASNGEVTQKQTPVQKEWHLAKDQVQQELQSVLFNAVSRFTPQVLAQWLDAGESPKPELLMRSRSQIDPNVYYVVDRYQTKKHNKNPNDPRYIPCLSVVITKTNDPGKFRTDDVLAGQEIVAHYDLDFHPGNEVDFRHRMVEPGYRRRGIFEACHQDFQHFVQELSNQSGQPYTMTVNSGQPYLTNKYVEAEYQPSSTRDAEQWQDICNGDSSLFLDYYYDQYHPYDHSPCNGVYWPQVENGLHCFRGDPATMQPHEKGKNQSVSANLALPFKPQHTSVDLTVGQTRDNLPLQ